MLKDDKVYLGHMLEIAKKASEHVKGKQRSDYDNNETLQFALAHMVQIIGEAARCVSQKFQSSHSEIPWRAIVGMRHKVVHDYMNVDEDTVWGTVIQDLPVLIRELEKILHSKGNLNP